MKVGIILTTDGPPKVPTADRIEVLATQVAMARDLGFDCVHVGQGFVRWPFQVIQPIPLLARLSTEAGEMRLGTGVLLLPLLHPVDVAEQIATLDNICRGRLDVGVGLGHTDDEFRAFSINRETRAERFEESLAIIGRLWSEDEVTFEGRYFQLSRIRPTAHPFQQPRPGIWIAANQDSAVRRAARLGDAWYASPHVSYSTLSRQMRVYRHTLEKCAKPPPRHVVVMRDVYVAENSRQAFDECRPFLGKRYAVYAQDSDGETPSKGDSVDRRFEEFSRERFIIGDPDECVETLRRYEALGFNQVILEFQWMEMPDGLAMRNLKLLGEQVLPKLR